MATFNKKQINNNENFILYNTNWIWNGNVQNQEQKEWGGLYLYG